MFKFKKEFGYIHISVHVTICFCKQTFSKMKTKKSQKIFKIVIQSPNLKIEMNIVPLDYNNKNMICFTDRLSDEKTIMKYCKIFDV